MPECEAFEESTQNIKLAAMAVGRTAAAVERQKAQFETHRDQLDNYINDAIVVREWEETQRRGKPAQGIQQSHSSLSVGHPVEAQIEHADTAQERKRTWVRCQLHCYNAPYEW